jgi:hypothetical protein
MCGVGDRALQALGRWKEPEMVQRYTNLNEQHLREAVEKVALNSPSFLPGVADKVEAIKSDNTNQINRVGR